MPAIDLSKNMLKGAKSPYLQQHADNPVHWQEWSKEILAMAKEQNKPILLSVGYAACHWCHVMAHESFEDDATAEQMNKLYINVKIDREERPDLDAYYQEALQLMGGQGGWPLTMFLTPGGDIVFGGTYFPPVAKYELPAFPEVLQKIPELLEAHPQDLKKNVDALQNGIREKLTPRLAQDAKPVNDDLLAQISQHIATKFDPINGGLQGAPKFPQASMYMMLWRQGLRLNDTAVQRTVRQTAQRICAGGIYDHLGGGFARYTVDEQWLIPHFEKMLYDNALMIEWLALLYAETKAPLFKDRMEAIIVWLLRDMQLQEGGFASAVDADSEGVEGKFYTWSLDELEEQFGSRANDFATAYGASFEGNFEGKNILNRLHAVDVYAEERDPALKEYADMRQELLIKRMETRVAPCVDDKALTDWNALMVAGLVVAANIVGKPKWLTLAKQTYAFIKKALKAKGKNRLHHCYKDGEAYQPGTLDDYAFMIKAAIQLFGATGKQSYLDDALQWLDVLKEEYWEEQLGVYYFSSVKTDDVPMRLIKTNDQPIPSGNAVMVDNLWRLGLVTGETQYLDQAQRVIDYCSHELYENFFPLASLLNSIDVTKRLQIAIVIPAVNASKEAKKQQKDMLKVLYTHAPHNVHVVQVDGLDSLAEGHPAYGKQMRDTDKPAVFMCGVGACQAPLQSKTALEKFLKDEALY